MLECDLGLNRGDRGVPSREREEIRRDAMAAIREGRLCRSYSRGEMGWAPWLNRNGAERWPSRRSVWCHNRCR